MEQCTNPRQLVVGYGRSSGAYVVRSVLRFLVLCAALGGGAPCDAHAQSYQAGLGGPLVDDDGREGSVAAARNTTLVEENANLWADLQRAGGRAYVGFRRASAELLEVVKISV